jgi:hypothetical protein
MSRIFCLSIIALLAAPVFADSDLIPVSGPPACLRYDVKTGRMSPLLRDEPSNGRAIWSAIEPTGYFTGRFQGDCLLDWGDIPAGVPIGRLVFSYMTNSWWSSGDNTVVLAVYANDNGWGTTNRHILACYEVDNLPGMVFPYRPVSLTINVDLDEPFVIDGDDLDGDALVDFSYVFWIKRIAEPNARLGPQIAGTDEPNVIPPSCPGIEFPFDRFANPDFTLDPNMNLGFPGGPAYLGTYWFGPTLFGQFYWEMFTAGCTEPGASGRYCVGDIGNFNCVVDLADLAQLLGHYGESPAAYWMGDIYPDDAERPGDGVIDLSDLAEMLSQYGDDCTD